MVLICFSNSPLFSFVCFVFILTVSRYTGIHYSMADILNITLEDILQTYLDAVKSGESGLPLLLTRLGRFFYADDMTVYTTEGVEAFMNVRFLTHFVILVLQKNS